MVRHMRQLAKHPLMRKHIPHMSHFKCKSKVRGHTCSCHATYGAGLANMFVLPHGIVRWRRERRAFSTFDSGQEIGRKAASEAVAAWEASGSK